MKLHHLLREQQEVTIGSLKIRGLIVSGMTQAELEDAGFEEYAQL